MADTNKPSGSFKDKAQDTAATAARGVRDVAGTAAHVAGETGRRAQDTAETGAHNLQQGAQAVAQRAGEMASSAASTASQFASNVGDRVEEAASTVGERMSALGGTFRDRGPHSGVLGSATSAVASGLETGGHYLQEQGLSGMFDDLQSLIRRHPIGALCVGVGIGFLMARAMSRE